MTEKQYLKMADVFTGSVTTRTTISANIQNDTVLILHGCQAKYAANAINSHDELVAENERLREALECATKHYPDPSKMAPEGWQLVPVEPTIEMVQAATHSDVGFGTRAAYQAMLAAAPKLGVVK